MRDVTFHQISPEMLESIKGKMLGHFEGRAHENDGEMIVKGVHVKYRHDGSGNCLTLSVVQTPEIVTAGYVIGQLYDAIDQVALK